MKKSDIRRLTALLAALAILLCLCGCVNAQDIEVAKSDAYQRGYTDGYLAGKADGQPDSSAVEDAYDSGYADGFKAALEEGAGQAPDYDALGFALITDVIPDAILEIRYYSTFNFVGERINGYEAPVAFLTKEAAAALKNASDLLKAQGYRIKIYDAYRPQQAVDHFKAWAEDLEATQMRPYFYPQVDKADLFTLGFIAARSGHSRGSTVDLTIVDMQTGRELDMGTGFDYFGELSHAYRTEGLTQEQIQNRAILRDAMIASGFRVLSTEWWHFTLENEPFPDTYFDFPVQMPDNKD